MTSAGLIYGGRGALGSVLVSHFKKQGWWIISVDTKANDEADANVIVDKNAGNGWTDQESEVVGRVGAQLGPDKRLDTVINVAGGWAGGSARSKDMIRNADLMWKSSVWTSTVAAKIAVNHLKEGGLLVLPGAAEPALKGTPKMIGYGMAKVAVHHLVRSLAEDGSGMPEGSQVYALLPETLDTPMNRKWMPKSDFSKWTPLPFVADLVYEWSTTPSSRPANGSLVKMSTVGGQTDTVMI